MGNCLRKSQIRDIEFELRTIKTNHRMQMEQITSELITLRQALRPQDHRCSYNPYLNRKREEIEYI